MDSLFSDYNSGILSSAQPPCLSLYLPTHRSHPDNYQDPIRFRNLVKKLEESLAQKYSEREFRPLFKPFETLLADHDFWQHTLDGLAVLSAPDLFRVYQLQRPVPELAIVAESFHLKPLMRILQSSDGYHILGISRHNVVLYEGNRDVLDKVQLPDDFPQSSEEFAGQRTRESSVSSWTYDAGVGGAGTSGGGVPSGRDVKAEQMEAETDRFFRAVDRALLERYSRPSRYPLLIAALPEQSSLFRKISHNPFLLEASIDKHPDSLKIEELRASSWQVVEPYYLKRLAGLIEMFETARTQEMGDHDLAQVARSAVSGRVSTLLIEAERSIPGRIDETTGRIEFDDLRDPEVDDLLDDLGELVQKNGGEVVIVPAERMPTKSGIAAIYRF